MTSTIQMPQRPQHALDSAEVAPLSQKGAMILETINRVSDLLETASIDTLDPNVASAILVTGFSNGSLLFEGEKTMPVSQVTDNMRALVKNVGELTESRILEQLDVLTSLGVVKRQGNEVSLTPLTQFQNDCAEFEILSAALLVHALKRYSGDYFTSTSAIATKPQELSAEKPRELSNDESIELRTLLLTDLGLPEGVARKKAAKLSDDEVGQMSRMPHELQVPLRLAEMLVREDSSTCDSPRKLRIALGKLSEEVAKARAGGTIPESVESLNELRNPTTSSKLSSGQALDAEVHRLITQELEKVPALADRAEMAASVLLYGFYRGGTLYTDKIGIADQYIQQNVAKGSGDKGGAGKKQAEKALRELEKLDAVTGHRGKGINHDPGSLQDPHLSKALKLVIEHYEPRTL